MNYLRKFLIYDFFFIVKHMELLTRQNFPEAKQLDRSRRRLQDNVPFLIYDCLLCRVCNMRTGRTHLEYGLTSWIRKKFPSLSFNDIFLLFTHRREKKRIHLLTFPKVSKCNGFDRDTNSVLPILNPSRYALLDRTFQLSSYYYYKIKEHFLNIQQTQNLNPQRILILKEEKNIPRQKN